MNSRVIYLKPSKSKKRAETLNHLFPGIILLFNGISSLADPGVHLFSPYLNIGAGSAVVAAAVYELRIAHHESNMVVSWIDIFAGVMLITEGLNIFHRGKIFQPGLLYGLLGIFTILKGVYHTKIPKVRRMTLTDKGFMMRTSPFRKIQMTWSDITGIQLTSGSIVMTAANGRDQTLRLRRIANGNEIFNALQEYVPAKITN